MASAGGGNAAVAKTVKVAQDGSGDYGSVQDAIDAVPLGNKERIIIHVLPGIYKQPIYVPKSKNMITLLGDRPETTILTWANTATSIQHHQVAAVIGTGTFASATVIVEGQDFIAQGITFENSSPQGSGQAVAIRVTADRCAFYGCRFLGWQVTFHSNFFLSMSLSFSTHDKDTAYLHNGRLYFRDCYVEGSVDFIFGNATVLLEHCHIHCKSKGFITAQQRTSDSESTGYVFLRCIITGTGTATPYMYLGRPWAPYARVLYAYTWMDGCIMPPGWNNWDKSENEKTASYYEYRCFGPGSDTSKRVTWAKEAKDEEIEQFLSLSFIDSQQSWLGSANLSQVPFVPMPLSA